MSASKPDSKATPDWKIPMEADQKRGIDGLWPLFFKNLKQEPAPDANVVQVMAAMEDQWKIKFPPILKRICAWTGINAAIRQALPHFHWVTPAVTDSKTSKASSYTWELVRPESKLPEGYLVRILIHAGDRHFFVGWGDEDVGKDLCRIYQEDLLPGFFSWDSGSLTDFLIAEYHHAKCWEDHPKSSTELDPQPRSNIIKRQVGDRVVTVIGVGQFKGDAGERMALGGDLGDLVKEFNGYVGKLVALSDLTADENGKVDPKLREALQDALEPFSSKISNVAIAYGFLSVLVPANKKEALIKACASI